LTREIEMRTTIALVLLAASLPACNSGDETRRVGGAVDTVVTTRQTQDTAIVTHDTTVKVDTTMERGDRSTRVDTVKKTRGTTTPADTGDTSRAR
jgi:hypothetical protein